MLRRAPTALTISPEDIQAYDDALSRRLAYAHFKKTGQDPGMLFGSADSSDGGVGKDGGGERGKTVTDPSDELKPLPGGKARIVRGGVERVMGAGAGAGGMRRG